MYWARMQNWSEVTVKIFTEFQKIYILINVVLLNFLFIKESWKKNFGFHKKY